MCRPLSSWLGRILSLSLENWRRTHFSVCWNSSRQSYSTSHIPSPTVITASGGSCPMTLLKNRETKRCLPLPYELPSNLPSLTIPLTLYAPAPRISTNHCGTISICTNPPNAAVAPSSLMLSRTHGSESSGMPVSLALCTLSKWGSPHFFSFFLCWVQLALPHPSHLEESYILPGSRHSDPIIDVGVPCLWRPQRYCTDSLPLSIVSGRYFFWGTQLMSTCTVFGSKKDVVVLKIVHICSYSFGGVVFELLIPILGA